MKTNYITDASVFLTYAGDVLAKDEARYGLIYGIARRLVENPHFYGPDDPWFCVLEEGTELRAVAMRTPPFGVLLAYFSGDTVRIAELLAEDISRFSPVIPGVNSESNITDPFVKNWCRLNNVEVVDKMSQLVYRLDSVNDVKIVRGKFRLAVQADRELVSEWSHAFHDELFTPVGRIEPEVDLADRIENNDVFLWEDEETVSMAVKSRPTGKGITVSCVYTPPQFRQKGYATSCVTSLCRGILRGGYEFCTLYTDQANPVSNSIYRKIGFCEICDSVMYTFSKPED
jgi:predicted GNAT family acetyltransferase